MSANRRTTGSKLFNAQRLLPRPVVPAAILLTLLLSGPNEARLFVYFWNGTAWSDDGITVLSRDRANHQVTIAITHLSEFAFFVTAPTNIVETPEPDGSVQKVFLPVIGR